MNMVEKMYEEEIRGSTIRNANLSVAAVVPPLTTTAAISTSSSSSSQVLPLINQQQSSSPPATPPQSNHISHNIILNNNNNNINPNNNVAIANSSSTIRNVIVSVNGNHQNNIINNHSNDDHVNHHNQSQSSPPTGIITTTTTSVHTSSNNTSAIILQGSHNDLMLQQQQQQQQQIISDPSSVGSKESIDLDLHDQDGQFNETSEGYPTENSGGSNNGSNNNSQQGYISILPPVGSVTVPCDQTDLKYFIEELCPVCGDKVSGYHYGLLTCESCKGFFKRTVQNKKVYTCVAERSCHIDKTQRKRCPFCRFQKCLDVGMKLEAVRADRMRGGRNKFGPMYKRDRARKLQLLRQRQLALQAIRGSMGGGSGSSNGDGAPSQLSPTGYQQPYTNMQIKQEIQIPQVSSLTSSPDSSPSPIVLALSQVNPVATTTMSLSSGPTNSSTTTSVPVLQNPGTDSKLWLANSTTASPHSLSPKTFSFDTGTNPTSTVDSGSGVETLRVSPMIREFVQTIDDREWQQQLYSLLQSQSYNQCEVDLFELMCKVLDQNLFSQVDWARNTTFFKDLKVDDQMKLLQNSWSDMLVLDHLHHRIHNGLPDETTLPNGQKFDLLGLGLLGVPMLAERFNELQNKLLELKFDVGDYICMKFLLLLNPDVRGITNRKTVLEGYENVQAALLDYTLTCYPSVTDKFSKLLSIIPEIHAMAARGEDHLYIKHVAGGAPTQTLLMEMLHAKRK